MAHEGNNQNDEISRVRNIFFTEGEQEYFKMLLKNPQEMAIHKELLKMDGEYLASRAKIVLDQVENGKMHSPQDMQTAEYALVHYFGAIQDIERVRVLEPERAR